MEKELRRNQSILRLSGIATIIFELWSIIKWVAYCIYNPTKIEGLLDTGVTERAVIVLAWILIIGMILIDGLIRCYVGKSAIMVSKGKKQSSVYIVVAILTVLVTVVSMLLSIAPGSDMGWDDAILQAVVDLSCAFIGIELIVAAINVRKIEKEMSA